MKSPTNQTFALFACAGLLMATVIGATNQERIRWKWHDNTVLLTMQDNKHGKVEFGLRDDGVVVWREIKPATTNSPAEESEQFNAPPDWRNWTTNILWTNIVMTNIILLEHGGTNSTIEPLWRNNGTQQLLKP